VARVLVGGAGSAASNGFLRSLRASGRGDRLIGMNASPTDLLLADVDEGHLVPPAGDPEYETALRSLIERTRTDVVHVQSDAEVARVSALRGLLDELGVAYLLPHDETIVLCQDKWSSYLAWRAAAVPVPETRLLEGPGELDRAFAELGPELWLREIRGAGGAGSVRTADREFARSWVATRSGWGRFTAAECLTERTVTWQSIWWRGELVVAQTRRRRSWAFARNAPTGVSGITGVGETTSDPVVDDIAERAIRAVSREPHGIFGVDMAYAAGGEPNPTEINIGRFFTTHEFFTRAGLNLPEIYVSLALDRVKPALERKINPLPDGLLWIRGMDVEPVLTTVDEVERLHADGL
jgi:glutathione synthase/RimK-type ligase-like ATP-grasp enzyme